MTTQETPDTGQLAVAGHDTAAAGTSPRRGPGPTPALRGHPGGPGLPEAAAADDRAADLTAADLTAADLTAGGSAAADLTAADHTAADHTAAHLTAAGIPAAITAAGGAGGAARPGDGLAGTAAETPWQRAVRNWREAGVDWLREPGWLPERAWSNAASRWIGGPEQRRPIGADWDLTEPIPAVPAAGREPRSRPRPQRGTRPGGNARPGGARPGGTRPRAGRGSGRMVAGPVVAGVAVLALASAIVAAVFLRQPESSPGKATLSGYPPALVPGRALPAGHAGVLPALNAVAASGNTVVAAGSQLTAAGRRTVILVSADGGATWRPAALRAPGGDVSSGAVPFLLAGGAGGWLAAGAQGSWLSASGQVWRQEPGIALQPGDRVLSLARTADGFLAVGANVPAAAPSRASGVVWTSPDGITWRRGTAARLGLRTGAGRVAAALDQVAVNGKTVLVTGGFTAAGARPGKAAPPARVWRSTNGGATWTLVRLPAGHGAAGLISGVAPERAGFVLVRPGRAAAGQPDAVAYRSPDGARWQFAGVLAATGHAALQITGVTGDDNGAVVAATEKAGHANPVNVAFLTGTGRSWHRVLLLGSAADGRLAGAAAGPAGTVLSAGSLLAAPGAAAGGAAAGGRQTFLLQAGSRYAFTGQQVLAGAATAAVNVTALASAAGLQVAAGSAGGSPAIWTAPAGGRWSAVPAGTWAAPGLTLSGVTAGGAGWLAVGQVVQHRQAVPVVLASPDGRAWQPVPGLRRLTGPGTVITQAAGDQTGFVMVGEQPAGGVPAAVAYWSADSSVWSQAAVTAAAAPPGSPAGQHGKHAARQASEMLGVTAGGPGFVAVGALGGRPSVWSSPDGRGWQPAVLPLPAGARSAVLRRVAAHGQRVDAVGTAATATGRQAFAAVSADAGRSWRVFPLPLPACPAAGGAAGPGGVTVTAVAAVGSGFVATGTCGPAGRLDVVVWSSPDGRTWTAATPQRPGLSGPGAQQITALTASGRSLIGAGYTATLTGGHPTLWRLRDPQPRGGR